MVTVVATIFVLGVLIFIHELGHFTVAKGLGIRVERFSLGFPPKLIGKKIGDTEYLISWVPLGGYVRMAGDNPEEPLTGKPWEFLSRPRWQRMLVIIAGPAMNYVFAFLLAWMIITFGGMATVDSVIEEVRQGSLAESLGLAAEDRVVSVGDESISTWDEIFDAMLRERGKVTSAQVERGGSIHELVLDLTAVDREEIMDLGISPRFTTEVGEVEKGGPAFRAGIRSGDIIEAIDGQKVSRWAEMVDLIQQKPDSTIAVRWRRQGQITEARLKTKVREMPDEQGTIRPTGFIGITSRVVYKKIGFFPSALEGLRWTWEVTKEVILFIKGLITGEVSAKMVGGPIFIAQVAGQSARQGFSVLLSFMALLSVNLALLNVLPIPVLDGGHLLILLVETVKKKSLSAKQRLVIQQIGLAMIVLLIMFVVFNDVTRGSR